MEETKALVTESEAAELSAMTREYFQNQDESLKLVVCTIGQGSPKAPAKVGHFNFSTGESKERLTGVTLLTKNPSNVFYAPQGAKSKAAICASDDGINPAPRIQNPINGPEKGGCLSCPLIMWSQEDNEASDIKNRIAANFGFASDKLPGYKPLCTPTINVIMLDEDETPFKLQVQKHNIDRIDKLITMVKTVAMKLKFPGFAIKFDMWLKPMEGQGNRSLLQFSQSKDFRTTTLVEAKARKEMDAYFRKNGQALLAQIHAGMDEANNRLAQEEVPF